ncbi:NUDIX hydrolase [Patescibacteria group bacterium]|nr:NUDIX hydrolase [Patescibacteria group bacterium]
MDYSPDNSYKCTNPTTLAINNIIPIIHPAIVNSLSSVGRNFGNKQYAKNEIIATKSAIVNNIFAKVILALLFRFSLLNHMFNLKSMVYFKKGAFGIILNKDKEILLCHRRDIDFWNLPGGGCGKKESFKNCVLREIKEETGLETKIEKLSGIYIKLKKKEIVFVFICKIIGGKKIITNEADKIEYFDIEKLPLNTIRKHIKRINGLIKKGIVLKI